MIKTNFLGSGLPKENMHCTCIACITIDSVMKVDKKNYPQFYLEKCKYKIRKILVLRFIKTELDSDSDSASHSDCDFEKIESKFNIKLMSKLEFGSNNDSE